MPPETFAFKPYLGQDFYVPAYKIRLDGSDQIITSSITTNFRGIFRVHFQRNKTFRMDRSRVSKTHRRSVRVGR